ncbi:MAG: hypothetical protein ABSG01_13215 [Anaerolineales bacterium]|jgi:hypothetical protein
MNRVPKFASGVVIVCLMVALLISVVLAGCSSGKTLEGSDLETVLAYSEPIADNLF